MLLQCNSWITDKVLNQSRGLSTIPYALKQLTTMNPTQRRNKIKAEIYFGIVGPPSSAFPKNEETLRMQINARPMMAAIV